MPAPSEPPLQSPDWPAIRRRYEATTDAAADICRDAGITRADLDKARKSGKWRRSEPRPFPAGRKPTTPPTAATMAAAPVAPPLASPKRATPARRASALSATARRGLLDRLAAAISLKLEQLERRMTKDLEQMERGEVASATDHERETRAIGALIDNLGKVTEMDTASPRAAGRSAAAIAPAPADLAGEADRYRREFAERLRKIIDATAGKP